ncbi:hypothetical protein OH77DRAFT_451132 [Trametes cingulata]|nr:hypothetical protein OH77DRAFT_451132 [Trametes cingulata]
MTVWYAQECYRHHRIVSLSTSSCSSTSHSLVIRPMYPSSPPTLCNRKLTCISAPRLREAVEVECGRGPCGWCAKVRTGKIQILLFARKEADARKLTNHRVAGGRR